jgi:hypothetical protein
MSITFEPSNPVAGQAVTFTLKYEGNLPPPNDVPPTDVHVEVETGAGWQPVVGYNDLSTVTDDTNKPIDPVKGFKLPIPPGAWNTPGQHRFRVRWTLKTDGPERVIGTETAFVTTSAAPSPSSSGSSSKSWSWSELLCRISGGAVAGAIFGAIANVLAGPVTVVCILTGLGSGGLGSLLGYIFTYLFDAPRIRWSGKSAFLFNLFFTLLFAMIFGLLAIGLEKESVARGEVFSPVIFSVGVVAGFLATVLAGVLNNLREET